MTEKKKKRGFFKKSSDTPAVETPTTEVPSNTPESKSSNEPVTIDMFPEENASETHNIPEPEISEAPAAEITSPEVKVTEPSAPETEMKNPEESVVVEKPVSEQNEAAVAAVKESLPEKIENILNQPNIPQEFVPVTPTSNHSDEMKLEKFIRLRKGPQPNVIHHMEMMGSGINMSKIGLLEGKVGKFKLKRSFVSEAWTITID